MADERWGWDAGAQKYRNLDSGRFLPARRIQEMRDQLLATAGAMVARLTKRLVDGKQTVAEWEQSMRDAIKAVFGAQYVFGRGGLKAMQPADWEHLGELVQTQYGFLSGFADEVAAGKLSAPQIRIRVELYVGSSVQAHEAGKGAAWYVELPAMPADGSAICMANDRCSWFLRRRKDGKVEATWVADLDERTCKTCRKRARDWNPLILTPGQPAPREVPTTTKRPMPSREVVTV